MPHPPNQVYTAFSFIGFVMSAIPFYWHLEAWNTGTCLFMFWAGLGCLVQCISSIVWNGNIVNRAPVYCLIATRIQVALNVALPACSLCINRRLYKIATAKAVMITRSDRRRTIIHDLLIGLGLPILQIPVHFIVSSNRYDILEDFGPYANAVNSPPTYFLFYAWPLAIGTVSLFYCVMNIYTFYKRHRQFKEIMSSNPSLSRSRYFRLMAISAVEICGTIPLSIFFIVNSATSGVEPWKSWADTHSHYSTVNQVAGFIWRQNPGSAMGLEVFRWSLVLCAFVFFALFGFADEARQHYRLVYTTLASRIGYSTFTLHGSSHATSSVPFVKSRPGITVSVVTTGDETDKRRSSVSFSDHPSVIPSISLTTDLKIEDYSPSESMTSASVESFEEDQLPALPAGIQQKAFPRPDSGVNAV